MTKKSNRLDPAVPLGDYREPVERQLYRRLFRAGAAHAFLREPIERMRRVPNGSISALATDGACLYYAPEAALSAEMVDHLLVHCLFRHFPPPENAIRPLWDLACDMSAEYLRTELFPAKDGMLTRLRVAEAVPEGVDPRVARAVYRHLMERFEDELEPLYARFTRDDHRYWYAPAGPRLSEAEATELRSAGAGDGTETGAFDPDGDIDYRQWLESVLAARWPSEDDLPGGVSATGRYGLHPGSREERQLLRAAGKYDFSRYLRRYATMREEARLDLGSFDYIPYCYGLERYGNMPLVEPLEYAERHRVETLVIAIDTSGSCTRPILERFLGEIERILMRHDCFFKHMCVHIVQCDAMIQSHAVIHTYEAWQAYRRDLVIRGRGGTDFTPVFKLVERLRRTGALRNLKGLIYFTDGDGVYPRQETPYETAFVFTTRKALSLQLPKWIVPLCLERIDNDL